MWDISAGPHIYIVMRVCCRAVRIVRAIARLTASLGEICTDARAGGDGSRGYVGIFWWILYWISRISCSLMLYANKNYKHKEKEFKLFFVYFMLTIRVRERFLIKVYLFLSFLK